MTGRRKSSANWQPSTSVRHPTHFSPKTSWRSRMINAMVYHGLSLNSSNLGVDIYVSFAISAGVEVVGILFGLATIERKYFGRRNTNSGCLLIGGVACLSTAAIPPGPILTTVAMVGKFGISVSFNIMYLYTLELYPTEIRGIAIGTCSMFSRVANLITPFILLLSKYWSPLPLVIYGALTVLAGFVSLCLPETLGQDLPETYEDGKNVGKAQPEYDDHGDQEMTASKYNRESVEDYVNPGFTSDE